MSKSELLDTIARIAVPGKGILAADESHKTIGKRFASINLDNTELNRRDYREMLFTTPELAEWIGGVILFEETLGQKSSYSVTLADILAKQGIIPGIKVDKGLVTLPLTHDENVTQGLDGLPERLATYKEMGARFAKWRAVFTIGQHTPSRLAIKTNANMLARYAAICQNMGIVPIVEPEVLMDGDHDLERCHLVTTEVLHQVFNELYQNHVFLEGIILKPSMVIPGEKCTRPASVEQVARATVEVLKRTVPAAVPTINFLSGGQSAELSTEHLNAMNQLYPNLPWLLSFSYGRALQAPSLDVWHGKAENKVAAQKVLFKRSKLNGLASKGQYDPAMEKA